MATPRARLDAELVRRGLAASRAEARRLIDAQLVTIDGAPATKAASQVTRTAALVVADPGPRWASRAGTKLAGALHALGVEVSDRRCLDAGASTGGFTDVLLDRGAAHVTCVDVGYGQLAWRLATDARVTVVDRTNVRHLQPEDLPGPPPDVVTADLSFISLRLVVGALARVAAPTADHLLMVKPQFEVGPEGVGSGGVVRDPQRWAEALHGVGDAAAAVGLVAAGACCSPLPGPAGNVELFWHLRGPRHPAATESVDIEAAVARAVAAGQDLGRVP